MSERANHTEQPNGADDADENAPAGRTFTFTERSERSLIDGMRDLDEIMGATKRVYPSHTWSRSELLLLFFLDSCADRLDQIAEALDDE